MGMAQLDIAINLQFIVQAWYMQFTIYKQDYCMPATTGIRIRVIIHKCPLMWS